MKANILQLEAIEKLRKESYLEVGDYGFYSDGSIGVHVKDQFGEYSVTIYENGKTTPS